MSLATVEEIAVSTQGNRIIRSGVDGEAWRSFASPRMTSFISRWCGYAALPRDERVFLMVIRPPQTPLPAYDAIALDTYHHWTIAEEARYNKERDSER